MAATMSMSLSMNRAGVFARRPAKAVRRSAVQPIRAASQPQPPTKVEPEAGKVPDEVLDYAKTMPGISQPFPNIFDPLNFLANTGASNTRIRELRRWRESELTHGRVAMLATLGFLYQENFPTLPLFGHVTGPAIGHFQQVEAEGVTFWTPLVFAIGIAESFRIQVGWNDPTSGNFYSLRDDYEPGNLGFDPLGLLPQDPKEKYDMQTKELNNGRLAMIAIAAFVVQEELEKDGVLNHLLKRTTG